MNYLNKSSLVLLVAAVLICLGLIIYISSLPTPGASFSEFYILNENGKPCDYPVQAAVGRPVNIILGVVNHEAKAMAYTVRIMCSGVIIKSVAIGAVNQGQRWEEKTDIVAGAAGAGTKIEFYLYVGGEQGPHISQPLVLTLDVKGP